MWAAISKHADGINRERIALCDSQQSLTYAELANRVTAAALQLQQLELPQRLCALVFTPTVETVVQYLACYCAKVPVLLLESDVSDAVFAELQQRYRFAAVYCAAQWQTLNRRASSTRPDLQLLLTTSGSTGAPKAVMLSNASLVSNAHSIIEYLQLGADDVGISSMPLNYSFGMSLLHTHLVAGATFVLTAESFVSRKFWQLVEQHHVTSLSGVPFSFQMLKTMKFAQMALPSLRVLTQAGGRLPLELSKYFAALSAERGWRFYQMYGQTEAAPRIAYLPPEAQAEFGDCIGKAVPGGELLLRDISSELVIESELTEGELCYRGPNVMLGYAMDASDLDDDSCIQELRTGDMAERLANGLYRITGRRSRFIKIRGKRMSLDHIEQMLQGQGITDVMVSGRDELLLIAITSDVAKTIAQHYVATLQLHPTLYKLLLCNELPRYSNNKANYPALIAMAAET